MADTKPERGSTEYTSSQAPDTQAAADRSAGRDLRLFPGGDPERSNLMVGMESMERGDSVDTNLGQTTFEASREDDASPRRHGQ